MGDVLFPSTCPVGELLRDEVRWSQLSPAEGVDHFDHRLVGPLCEVRSVVHDIGCGLTHRRLDGSSLRVGQSVEARQRLRRSWARVSKLPSAAERAAEQNSVEANVCVADEVEGRLDVVEFGCDGAAPCPPYEQAPTTSDAHPSNSLNRTSLRRHVWASGSVGCFIRSFCLILVPADSSATRPRTFGACV